MYSCHVTPLLAFYRSWFVALKSLGNNFALYSFMESAKMTRGSWTFSESIAPYFIYKEILFVCLFLGKKL